VYWLTAALLTAFLLFGCRAKKEIDWEYECTNRFPTKTVYIPGKDTTLWDTIREAGLIIQSDPIIRFKKCPDNLIIKGRTVRVDTLKIENAAKIKLLERENKESGNLLHESQQQTLRALKIAEEVGREKNQKERQRNWLALATLGLLIFAFRKNIFNLIKSFVTFI